MTTARMEDAGERYTTARMHVLGPTGAIPKRPRGYALIGGGSHPDTAAVLRRTPVRAWGGTGFLYAVFEYQGLDPMLSIGVRHTMMGHDFARTALERSGVAFELIATASAARADRAVVEALGERIAPLVTVDDPALPYSVLPEMSLGLSAQQDNRTAVLTTDGPRVAVVDLIEVTSCTDRRSNRMLRTPTSLPTVARR